MDLRLVWLPTDQVGSQTGVWLIVFSIVAIIVLIGRMMRKRKSMGKAGVKASIGRMSLRMMGKIKFKVGVKSSDLEESVARPQYHEDENLGDADYKSMNSRLEIGEPKQKKTMSQRLEHLKASVRAYLQLFAGLDFDTKNSSLRSTTEIPATFLKYIIHENSAENPCSRKVSPRVLYDIVYLTENLHPRLFDLQWQSARIVVGLFQVAGSLSTVLSFSYPAMLAVKHAHSRVRIAKIEHCTRTCLALPTCKCVRVTS